MTCWGLGVWRGHWCWFAQEHQRVNHAKPGRGHAATFRKRYPGLRSVCEPQSINLCGCGRQRGSGDSGCHGNEEYVCRPWCLRPRCACFVPYAGRITLRLRFFPVWGTVPLFDVAMCAVGSGCLVLNLTALNVPDGAMSLSVNVSDPAGNRVALPPCTFVVDTVPPTLRVTTTGLVGCTNLPVEGTVCRRPANPSGSPIVLAECSTPGGAPCVVHYRAVVRFSAAPVVACTASNAAGVGSLTFEAPVFTAWATATNRSSINVRVFSGANNATSGVVAVDLEVGAFSSLGGV